MHHSFFDPLAIILFVLFFYCLSVHTYPGFFVRRRRSSPTVPTDATYDSPDYFIPGLWTILAILVAISWLFYMVL